MTGGPPSPDAIDVPRVDLHTHSWFSDGEDDPDTLARIGIASGVVAMALTDHDCLDGFEAFARAAEGFEPVCGVEVSARREESDVHLIALFVSTEDERFRERLAVLARHREERVPRMVEGLRAAGIPVTAEHVHRVSGRGTPGRPHVARAIVELGRARDVEDAFRRFLRPGLPGYVPKPGPPPEEAIRWVHEAGGVAVLAHPGPLGHDAWIPELAREGLDGIEVWHPRHRERDRAAYARLAESLDLVPSGGSDYHGPAVGDARVGQEPVPESALDRLRRRRPRP